MTNERVYLVDSSDADAVRLQDGGGAALVISSLYFDPIVERLEGGWIGPEKYGEMPVLVAAWHRVEGPWGVDASTLVFMPEENLVQGLLEIQGAGWTPDLSYLDNSSELVAAFRLALAELIELLRRAKEASRPISVDYVF